MFPMNIKVFWHLWTLFWCKYKSFSVNIHMETAKVLCLRSFVLYNMSLLNTVPCFLSFCSSGQLIPTPLLNSKFCCNASLFPFYIAFFSLYKYAWLQYSRTIIKHTVVWKIFIWNYFVVENVRQNYFRGFPIPTKIF